MAQFPCLPLWTDALLADTGHLSDAEFGRYMRVLILMWRTPGCRVPNDDAWLTRHLPRTPTIEDIRTTLAEYCQTDGNWITQKRLKREFVDRFEFGGRMSALAKRKKKKTNGANNNRSAADAQQQMHSPPSLNPSTKEPSLFGESQQPPPVENPPATKPETTQQDPSANGRATALPKGAPARPPPPQKLAPSPELVATVANQLGYPLDLTEDEKRLIAIEPNTWTPARILAQRNQSSGR